MAHLAGEKLMAFLGPLAARHIEEDAVGEALVQIDVITEPARGYPTNLVADDDAEVDLVRPDDRPRGDEG